MTRLALAALCVALLTGCGGGGSKPVAHVGAEQITAPPLGGVTKPVAPVGSQQISEQQLDALVQHFRREAQLEGKDFPKDGTSGFVQLRNQLLGLLVYRAELRQAADRLGVEVDQDA